MCKGGLHSNAAFFKLSQGSSQTGSLKWRLIILHAVNNGCFSHSSFLGRITTAACFQLHSLRLTQQCPCILLVYTCFVFSELAVEAAWSTEGVTRVTVSQSENSTVVQCNSTHLTSFAVLVDVAGSQVSISF